MQQNIGLSCGFCHLHFLQTNRRYQGEWSDDKMTGRGYMIWADGRRYDGYVLFPMCLSQLPGLSWVAVWALALCLQLAPCSCPSCRPLLLEKNFIQTLFEPSLSYIFDKISLYFMSR
jgi:hypothetical protein